jgi:hypothetical protein
LLANNLRIFPADVLVNVPHPYTLNPKFLVRGDAVARKSAALLYLSCLVACLFVAQYASAQAVYGSIFGTVSDPSGAAVPNAKVTVTSVKQGTSEIVTTNETGNYNVYHLIPGAYDVTVEAQGFKKTEKKAVGVSADVATRVDSTLQLGGATEVVEVTGEAQQLKTDRADVATLFSEKQVEELPIFNRNFTQFVLLTPGTQQQSWNHAASENPQGSKQTKVNGQTFSGTGFQLDGTENRDPILGIIVINPPLDSVTEAKITSQNYDAEFGQAIAGVVTSQTKSGSNDVHGSVFGFRRSDATQARDPFANQQIDPLTGRFLPQTLWGQFGAAVGGPIIKNKLFFFGDYQGTRRKNGRSFTQTVPSLLVRSSCLSGAGCNLSEYLPTQIADPLTGTPFPGNIIPANRVSPQALAILAALPPPNRVGTSPVGPSNYAANGSGIFDDDQFDIRIDHQTTNNLHVFGRYSLADYRQTAGGAFGDLGGGGFGENGFAGTSNSRNQSIASGFDYALSPMLLTDFRFGWMRYKVEVSPNGVGTTPAQDIGIPGLNLGDTFTSGQPAYIIGSSGESGVENTGDIARTGAISQLGYGLSVNRCNCPLLESENQYQFVNNWTKIVGNHSFKFGGDIRYALNLRVPSDAHRAGELSFAQERTSGGGATGVALATFLLGDVTTFRRYVSTKTDAAERQKRWFFYGQDTFRITPKLTLSYGLRWDIYFPESVNDDGNGGLLDLSTGNIRVAGVGGIDRNFNVDNSWTNFAPRLGVAYQLTDKTVFRMGYGRSFDIGVFGSIFGHTVTQNLPVLSVQDLRPSSSTAAVFSLAAGPPPPLFPAVPADGLLPLPDGVFARARPLKMRLPTLDAWNLTVQHQLTNTLSVEAAYVGNKGTHGFVQNNPAFNVNQATVVGFLGGEFPTCGPGVLPPCNPTQNSRKQFFNAYGWTQNVDFYCNCTSSNYHSLQTKVEKRFSQGLSFLAHYTWSKSLDYDGDYYPIDPKVAYGPDDFSRKHVLVLSQVYELPLGRGKKYMSDANRLLDLLIGGFQINSVTNWSSGLPFTPSYADCRQDVDVGPCRVIVVGDVDTSGDRDGFFTSIPTGSLGTRGAVSGPYMRPQVGQFGNRRNSVYGPRFFNTDLSIFKNFIITERVRAQFRAEAFNIFNHVNLGQPNGCVDCSGAGTISSIAPNSLMRQFQFGARFTF